MKRWEISMVQAAMLIAGVVSLSGHALAVSHFMRAGGRDAWMSGIFALPAAFLVVWSFYRLRMVYPNDTVVQYLPKLMGKVGYVVAAVYPLYYFTVVVFTLRMTTDWMVDSILPETPSWVMAVLYMAAVLYSAGGGLDVLARINQFLLPLLMFFGALVSVSTLPAKDYSLLTPFFEKGIGPVLATTFLGMGYFGEISVINMYNAYIRKEDRKHMLKAYSVSLIFIVMTLTGPLAGSVATLGYRVAQNMPYPTFQHWLMVSYARFFERTDLLAVHQWLAGAYVRSGLYLLMAVHGLLQLTKLEKRVPLNWALAGFALLTVVASEAFPNKPIFDQFVIDIYLPAGAYIGVVLPVVLLITAWARGLTKKRQGAKSYGG